MSEMDKRKLRLILLLVVGAFVLTIGIKAATIYSAPLSYAAWWDFWAETCFGKTGESLTSEEEQYITETFWDTSVEEQVAFARQLDLEERNAEFTAWLLKWIAKPFGLFAILTAALVASRIISQRIRPPSSPS